VPSLFETLADRLRAVAWRFLRPTPQSIALSVVRGGGLEVDLAGVTAGGRRTWRDAIGVAEDSVLLLLASVNVEHGTLGNILGVEPDTNVELTVSVDGAPIGRSLVTVRQATAAVVSCTTAIRVTAGVRRVAATLHPFDAGVKVGDHVLATLAVPETMADISSANP
jgi:hypothetical protein